MNILSDIGEAIKIWYNEPGYSNTSNSNLIPIMYVSNLEAFVTAYIIHKYTKRPLLPARMDAFQNKRFLVEYPYAFGTFIGMGPIEHTIVVNKKLHSLGFNLYPSQYMDIIISPETFKQYSTFLEFAIRVLKEPIILKQTYCKRCKSMLTFNNCGYCLNCLRKVTFASMREFSRTLDPSVFRFTLLRDKPSIQEVLYEMLDLNSRDNLNNGICAFCGKPSKITPCDTCAFTFDANYILHLYINKRIKLEDLKSPEVQKLKRPRFT